MIQKIYDKLVRDNIPQILESNNLKFKAEYLSDPDVLKYVMRKLGEESGELFEAVLTKNRDGIISELADILSVMFKICMLYDIDPQDIILAEEEKSEVNGCFDDNCILKYVEEPEENFVPAPKKTKKPRKKKSDEEK